MKARRGSLRRAAQDLAPLMGPIMNLAYWAVEGNVPASEVRKLVTAAIRGEIKQRAAEAKNED